jgi:hypothetical protein
MASIRQWSIDDVICTSRGSKIANLKCDDGNKCAYTPPTDHVRIPFEPSTFDKDPTARRLNLVLECDEELQAEIKAFDAWIIQYLTEHSERILKKTMTAEQVAAGYSSCLKAPVKVPPSGKKYKPTLKTKIDLDGRYAVRCWNTDGESVSSPHTWKNLKLKPRIIFSHLWIMGNQFGVVVRITDAQLAGYDPDEDVIMVNPFR